jgi:hypothetical protein
MPPSSNVPPNCCLLPSTASRAEKTRFSFQIQIAVFFLHNGKQNKFARQFSFCSAQFIFTLTNEIFKKLTMNFPHDIKNRGGHMPIKRTVLRSSKGKKLYAVRDANGRFKDIQSYKKAHSMDIKRKSKAELAKAAKAKAKPKVKAKVKAKAKPILKAKVKKIVKAKKTKK